MVQIDERIRVLYNKNKQNKAVDWIQVDPEDSTKRKVLAAKLGDVAFEKNKNKWKLFNNEHVSKFWEYKPLTHEYADDTTLQDIAQTQNVWQPANFDLTSTVIDDELKKHNIWTAKALKDSFLSFKEDMKKNSVPMAQTIGKMKTNKMLFADGVLYFDETGNLTVSEASPNDFFTDFCDYTIKDALTQKAPLTNKWFDETFGESALTLKQYIGYTFFTTYKLVQAFVIIQGKGGDGKSTVIRYIENLFPRNEVANISLEDIARSEANGKNFSLSELHNKRLNTNDDITGDFINDVSKLKILTGSGSLNMARKFTSDERFSNYAKLLFACNELPSFRDSSNGLKRRTYILNAHNIPNFKNKYDMKAIYNERGAFVVECIKAFCEQLKQEQEKPNNQYAELYRSADTIKEVEDWSGDNDPVQLFIAEALVPLDKVSTSYKVKVNDMFEAYTSWADKSKVGDKLGKIKFNRELEAHGFTKTKAKFKDGTVAYSWKQARFNSHVVKYDDYYIFKN